jgi:hypothetical protein
MNLLRKKSDPELNGARRMGMISIVPAEMEEMHTILQLR